MNAKDYLSKIKTDREHIQRLKQRKESIGMEYNGITGIDYTRERVQKSYSNAIESAAWGMLERLEQIDKDIVNITLDIDRKLSEIETLENGIYVQILFMQYSENKNLKEIAEIMGYDYKYVCKLNGDALRAFEKMYLKELA